MEPPPIDAQLIEQRVPTAISSIQPERTVAVHKRKSLPMVKSQQPPVTPQVSPRIEQNPTAQKPEVTANPSRNEVQSNSLGDTSANNAATNETQSKTAENTSAKNAIQTGSYDGNGKSRDNMYANSGARAIDRPMPQIPDELRNGAFNSSARARFNIAADGSVKVELIKPTPNPRLNQILLDSLRKWRFIPAIKNGRPVASIEEIVVKVEVN
jgi:protein TonB